MTMESTPRNTFSRCQTTDLTAAFHQFNQYTLRLEESYNQLQSRVKAIDAEMAHANACLSGKVQELDSLTKYLHSLLGSIHSGVIAINLKGEISTFNKAAEKILRLNASDVLGKRVDAILKSSNGSAPLMLLTLKRGRNCVDVKRQIETDKGLSKWIESSVSLIKDAHDNTIGAVEVFRDLSEIRELETRLRKADKLAAIGAMSACIAHEIRNPLNGIEGFSALLARDFSDSDPRKKLVKNIIQGTKNLNKTVTELLVFARPLKLSISDCRISEILNKTLFFVAEDMKQKGISGIRIIKEFTLDAASDKIRCDAEKLQQAFLNLCMNAVQSMTQDGVLTVFTAKTEDHNYGDVLIGIKDTGTGIKKELVGKIFDPFFTTKHEGTGLGLAIVNKIVEAHNGKILFESLEGSGTTFYTHLLKNPLCDLYTLDDMFSKTGELTAQFA